MSTDTDLCHKILHNLGFLHFSHCIFPSYVDINNQTERGKYINSLVDYEELFKTLRYYANLYYSTPNNPIPSAVFDIIESLHGNQGSDEEKKKILTRYWEQTTDRECNKNVYILPFIFGYIEMALILSLYALIIYIIYSRADQVDYYLNYLFNLSLILIIIISLHFLGIIYQLVLLNNTKLDYILYESKNKFTNDTSWSQGNENEKYIALQKWLNLLVITCHRNYEGTAYFSLIWQKYMFLLLIAIGTFTICLNKDQFNMLESNFATKIGKIYLVFQLIIFPAWFVLFTLGFRRFCCCKAIKCSVTLFILMYIISTIVLSIHYYDYQFLRKYQMISHIIQNDEDNDNWIKWLAVFNLGFNILIILWMLFCRVIKYSYFAETTLDHRRLKYYIISILLVYAVVTFKIFLDTNNYWSSGRFQDISTFVLYLLIAISNLVYFNTIHLQYYSRNNVIWTGHCQGLRYSFFCLFCGNKCFPKSKYDVVSPWGGEIELLSMVYEE